MEIKFKNKKRYGGGFTIVELVIVIAVIGILSAILIPTFVGLVNKASVSADVMTVKNINTQLKIDEEINGKPATYGDMLAVASNAGYDVNKLNPTTDGYSIVWDMSQNLLFLYDKDGNLADNQAETPSENKSDLWSMTTETPAENLAENSIAGNVYLNNDSVESVTISYGIEVSGETDVNFTTTNSGTYNVVLNGGNLTVNAENATVNGYGAKNEVTVTAVDKTNSYHENGSVKGNIYLTSGHLVIENGADVTTIVVNAKNTNAISIEDKTGTNVSVAATNETVAENLASVVTGTNEVSTTPNTSATLFAGGLGTEKSPYLIATAEQFNNIIEGTSYYYKQINDITLPKSSSVSIAGTYDGGNYELSIESCNSNSNTLFDEISGHTTFKNINVVMDNYAISLLLLADWETAYGADFENITFSSTVNTVTSNSTNFGYIFINAIYTSGNTTVEYNFKNITNNVPTTVNNGTCTAFIIGSGPCYNTLTILNFENCINNGDIVGTSSVGYLYGNSSYIGSYKDGGREDEINVINCQNNGVLSSSQDNSTVAFAPKLDEINNLYQEEVGGSYISSNLLKNQTIYINQNGTEFSINQAISSESGISYELVFNVYSTYNTIDGLPYEQTDLEDLENNFYVSNGKKYKYDLTVDENLSATNINTFKALDKRTAVSMGIIGENETLTYNSDGFAIVNVDNTSYLIFNTSSSTYINSGVSILVYAYNASGILVGTANVK